ncbi:MAG TPA: hypothetical protein VMS74_09690 [Acidimicrobiia bacterium]|nr:hypothetical protein [Acidimicrobiia bacterium]
MSTRSRIRGAETSIASIRERFGGIDTPAALGGLLAIIGVLALISSLVAAGAGALTYQVNAIDLDGNLQEMEMVGVLLATLVVFVAGLVGGWVAGRMARFDGVMNGIAAAIWLLLLVAVFAALGAWVGEEYNAFRRAGLPDWLGQLRADDLTFEVIVASAVGIAALFTGALVGGGLGDAHNRKVDAALTDSVATPRS